MTLISMGCARSPKWVSTRVLLVLLAALVYATAAYPQSEFQGVERIVAIGDVHGGFDELVTLMRGAGLIDGRNQWKGGKTHFVQTGDVVDRGAESRKVLDLLMDLQQQAVKDGGMVHPLLGNHEEMNIIGDLRYVDHGEYDAFRTKDSREIRDAAYERLADPALKGDRRYHSKWEDDHPLGWVEHLQAFSREGKYGKWLRSLNAVIKINRVLFAHGGVSPKYVTWSLQDINDRVRAELQDFSRLAGGITTDPLGPLWYRGLADGTGPEISAHVDAALKRFDVDYMVIAHTPTPGIVLPRFGAKVIVIDVGLSRIYGEGRACLVFEGAQPFALHRGRKIPIPIGNDIAAFMQYLRAAEFLEPPESHLHDFVRDTARALGTK